jgi:hypothetical protein
MGPAGPPASTAQAARGLSLQRPSGAGPTYPTAGGCRGYGIVVLTIADDTIAALTGFPDPVRGATSAPRL